MKLFNIAVIGAAAIAMAACADDFDTNDYKVQPSEETSQYEYLNDYGTLKSYVNYSNVGPRFRLGGALDAEKLAQRGLEYALAVSNYDEVTFGNHMKHNFVMAADGSMDFGRIRTAIEVARAGGLGIFGHTLCWHEQQQGKYLLSLIKDKELEADPDAKNEVTDYDLDWGTKSSYDMWGSDVFKATDPHINAADGCLEVINPEKTTNFWDFQFQIGSGFNLKKNTEYTITIVARCTDGLDVEDNDKTLHGGVGTWSTNKSFSFELTPDWSEYIVNYTPDEDLSGCHALVQFGHLVGTVQFKSVKITHNEAPAITIPVDVFTDDFSGESTIIGWGNNSTREVVDGVMQMTNPSVVNSWEAQAGYDFSNAFEVDTRYFLKLKIKGTKAGSIGAGFQNPDGYKGCGDFSAINITTDWNEVTVSTTCSGEGATRFLFSYGAYDGTIYIDELSIYYEKSANAIPLTPEEKAEILKADMKRWVYGMMEACDGYVTAWDVVNEAIMDGGNYGVKHGDDDDTHFYWQNYLGDNYVRYVVQYAREAFAEYGGNPDELLLFANDYNLEASYNNTAKTDGLIRAIQQWEADGVTRIDGIGTQMHVSYEMDPARQAKQEQCVVDMFTKLAASGKLVHVSELDMGIKDENGNTVKTADLTFEMKQKMAEYYKFIITKFFEIIPKEQQYGVVQWAATDSPEGSGWRAGEPIGIWDLNYSRKPAYAGFCEGLRDGSNL